MIGEKFHKWTVLKELPRTPRRPALYYLCRCDCGNEREIEGYGLRKARSKSCRSCAAKVNTTPRNLTHGMIGTKVYRAWLALKIKCGSNPERAKYYGNLGIKMHPAWRADFVVFFFHVGNPPGPHHTLDRRDLNRDFEPGNVMWVTQHEQASRLRAHLKAKTRKSVTFNCIEAQNVL